MFLLSYCGHWLSRGSQVNPILKCLWDLDNGSFQFNCMCSLVNHHRNNGIMVFSMPMISGTTLIMLGVHDLMIVLGSSISLFCSAISSMFGFPFVEYRLDIHSNAGVSWLELFPIVAVAGDVECIIVSGCCIVTISVYFLD